MERRRRRSRWIYRAIRLDLKRAEGVDPLPLDSDEIARLRAAGVL